MPLQHSKTDSAFKSNVKTLMGEVGASPHVKSRDQALAIAYAVKRRGRATGGPAPSPWEVRSEAHNMMHAGPIASVVPGRTDNHPMNVAAGSYVIPSEHVASLGEGNTQAGMAILGKMFGNSSPYGVGRNMGIAHGAGAPHAPRAMGFADGGRDRGGARGDGVGHPVPIMAAGGEFVVTPEDVARVGHGNIHHGHQILDAWVMQNRKKHINTLKKLPPPAKS